MPNLNDQLGAELAALRAGGLYRQLRTLTSAQGPRITLDGREFLNFSSNDYLGLANDPAMRRAAAEAIERWGVGAGASRLVSGNLAPYDELERKLAAFKSKEAAIVFSSGYAANVGTITALVGEGDVVILDKLDHASIIDGARQSGATVRVYPHKDMRKLEALLVGAVSNRDRSGLESPPTKRERRILITTETVFSMDGDLAPLAEIAALKEKYGVWLMIDEAHATGVFGPNRRGLAEQLGVENKVDITLGTLSKALGCVGGFVAGSQTLIDFLRNRARSLIYSTALPPAMCAAATAAVDFVASEEGARRCAQLWENVRALGVETPIFPVIVGDERAAVELSRQLYERGIFVPAIRYPTVPKGKARLRVTVTAGHTGEDVERLTKVISDCDRSRIQSAPTSDEDCQTGVVGAVSNRERPSHSADLRKGRVSIPNECYFITTCVDDRRPVLADPVVAREVIGSLRWLRDQGRIRLLGFVVMPDHVHVAVALSEGQTLARVMHSWKRHTATLIRVKVAVENRSHETERFWQPGYCDHLLRDRKDFEKRLFYMHDNPVRKGLVKFAKEYPFSTAHPDYEREIDWAWIEGVAVENRSHGGMG